MAGYVYWDQMFNYRGAAVTALTAMSTGTTATAGTYSPQLDGTLIKIVIILTAQAATSLCQEARVELSQTNWVPNVLRFALAGFGLATAPQLYGGNQAAQEFIINQPVNTSQPITGVHVEPGTGAVTPTILVSGLFSS